MIEIIQKIDYTPKKYITKVFLPAVFLSTVLGMGLFLLLSRLTDSFYIRLLPLLFPIFALVYAFVFPYVKLDNRKREIESKSHFFITAFGVLSKTDVDRKWLLKILSEKRELRFLARELNKIHILVAEWNQSLAQASRFISKRTPSPMFSDFLDRFAFSLDSGEAMDGFLFKEQENVMNDYTNYYRGALYEIDTFKEIYSAMVLSLAFLLTFVIIIPMLVGENILKLSLYVFVFFILIEFLMVYIVKTISPYDPIWHSRDMMTRADKRILSSLVFSIILCFSTIGVIYYLVSRSEIEIAKKIPFQIYGSLILTPLLLVGYVASQEENLVKRKDENFPSFLRSLGGSASAKGGLIVDSLYYLTGHDFGPLTGNIKDLYKRLHLGINNIKSWKLFSAETGSNMIDVFSKMFVESVNLGGDPGKVGDIISLNFSKIMFLRKQKFQVASSFTGISYGLTAGVAFSIAISFSIAGVINTLYTGLDVQGEFLQNIVYISSSENLQYVAYIIFLIMVVHSFFSAVLLRIMDGGHYLNSLMNFVMMVWLSAVLMIAADKVVNTLISTKPI